MQAVQELMIQQKLVLSFSRAFPPVRNLQRNIVCVAAQSFSTAPDRASLLAEPDEVASSDDQVVVDCCALGAYRRAHIPGAVRLPLDIYLKDETTASKGFLGFSIGADAVAELCAQLGIGADTPVVCYDDTNSLAACRFWWVLSYFGHANVRVLNGGWHRWATEGRRFDFHASRPSQPSGEQFVPNPDPGMLATAEQLVSALDARGKLQVVDARSNGEYAGTDLRGNPRGGHLPGAAHVEWTDLITSDDRRTFRDNADIAAILEEAGLDLAAEAPPIVTYCQGGIRAAHTAFALALLGCEAKNYDGSFGEWSRLDGAPLEGGSDL